ncbi:SDR family NAD(P)-dependent oxidoreductase [Aquabacter spiritensis]|uniref:2-hydroxycyclohexane-1-carbonyl-CoA dehydrogenase n=1 Tax=Aquabacter spiritensis TaxID=933073 RepID=A0A4R3LZX9_9HYPH|nr:SDR family NAD(P)-dependent oxidoreductase [Aquabacter spiritensis]TCT04357.1 2-hydroxycyclohexane-1-carbonyl-CoA dehydrogenase [Aquabacter spiritensis]
MNLGLEGRVALITGAGSGIGRAIAVALAAEGARIAVNDRDAAACGATVTLLREAGHEAVAAPFDVADAGAVAAGFAAIAAGLGGVDILVNNAAVLLTSARFVDTRPEDCAREIAVALFGTLHCTRAALPGMTARRHGRIVNIVSDAARVGQEKEVAYSSAKGGVIAFTKSLAREVGQDGITVNAVSPAATDTPLRRAALERLAERIGADGVAAREEKIRRAYPMRRIGTPEDAAGLVAFLASAQAGHITGQICSVNGGYAMPG